MFQLYQDQLLHFFKTSVDMLCVAGSDGYFKVVNAAWQECLGYTPIELTSRPYVDFVHPEDREATIQEKQELHGGRPTLSFENRYRHKDGSWKWLSWKATPQDDGSVFAVARDITAQKEAEKAQEILLRELEATNAELDQFAYIVSHDLKAPLRGIINLTEWIREDLSATNAGETIEHLQMLRGQAERMQRLIQDLLNYARVGRRDSPLESVDLARSIQEVMQSLQIPTDFTIEFLTPLEPLWGRPSDIFQLLLNLIGNAIKYRHPDRPGRLQIAQRLSGSSWILTFQDNGIGIDPKHHDRVFQIFQRLVPDDRVEGTGIGLAVVKKIVGAVGGNIRLESSIGQGSKFAVEWPVHPNHTSPIPS